MSACINHTKATVDGYGVVKHKNKTVRAHRLAYCLSKGIDLIEINGFVVMHKCDNRLCINPDHLLIGSHADNCADKVKKGRQAKGEKSGNNKLTENQVKMIRGFISCGESYAEIGRRYGVSTMCISRISRRITWSHV